MNNTVKFIAPTTPEQSLTELAKMAGESIEQSTQALVEIATALLEHLKTVQNTPKTDAEATNITPLYMSVSQALERYGVSRTTLYQIFQLDGCPKLGKCGKKILVPVTAFDEFFSSLIMEGKADEIN